MSTITALIIDDEQDSRETLRNYIGKYCPQVSIVGECANIIEAKAAILKQSPQLIFLCLLYTSPSPRDQRGARMPSSA